MPKFQQIAQQVDAIQFASDGKIEIDGRMVLYQANDWLVRFPDGTLTVLSNDTMGARFTLVQ